MCIYIYTYTYIHFQLLLHVSSRWEFLLTFFPRKSCILKSPTKKRSSKFSNSNPTKPNKTPFRHLNNKTPPKKRAFSSTSNLQYHHSLRSHLGGFVRILEENHNQTKPRYMILDMHRWIKESTWLPQYLFQTIDVFCIMCSRIDQKSTQIQENPTILFFFSIYILASISPMQNPLAQKQKDPVPFMKPSFFRFLFMLIKVTTSRCNTFHCCIQLQGDGMTEHVGLNLILLLYLGIIEGYIPTQPLHTSGI